MKSTRAAEISTHAILPLSIGSPDWYVILYQLGA